MGRWKGDKGGTGKGGKHKGVRMEDHWAYYEQPSFREAAKAFRIRFDSAGLLARGVRRISVSRPYGVVRRGYNSIRRALRRRR